eukprot:scaffold267_cov131-Isochrysis_galbana.AAC.2
MQPHDSSMQLQLSNNRRQEKKAGTPWHGGGGKASGRAGGRPPEGLGRGGRTKEAQVGHGDGRSPARMSVRQRTARIGAHRRRWAMARWRSFWPAGGARCYCCSLFAVLALHSSCHGRPTWIDGGKVHLV